MLLLTNFPAQSACSVRGPKRSPAIVSKPSLRPTYFAFSYLFFSFSMQQNYCNTFSFAKHFFSFGSQITKRQTEECLWYIHFITRLGCHLTYFNNKQVQNYNIYHWIWQRCLQTFRFFWNFCWLWSFGKGTSRSF